MYDTRVHDTHRIMPRFQHGILQERKKLLLERNQVFVQAYTTMSWKYNQRKEYLNYPSTYTFLPVNGLIVWTHRINSTKKKIHLCNRPYPGRNSTCHPHLLETACQSRVPEVHDSRLEVRTSSFPIYYRFQDLQGEWKSRFRWAILPWGYS